MTIDREQDLEDSRSMGEIIRESARRAAATAGIRRREQMMVADHLWNLRETPDNGLYAKPYWEDCIVMGDYLYSLGYRRVEEK